LYEDAISHGRLDRESIARELIGYGDQKRYARTLVDRHFSTLLPEADFRTAYEGYEGALAEKTRLLGGGTYVVLGGRSLARFPNANSVIICGGDGSRPATCSDSVEQGQAYTA
jgi:hypothetical protein